MIAGWERPLPGPADLQARAMRATLPQIETARLVLRAPTLDDFEAYATLLAQDHAGHIGGPFTRDEAWADYCEAVAGWVLRGTGIWAVDTRATRSLCGFVTLHIESGDPELELGYLLLSDARGQGFATEAAAAVRDYAFGALHLTTLVSYVDPDNAASRSVAERLGAVADPDLLDGCLVYRHPAPKESQ